MDNSEFIDIQLWNVLNLNADISDILGIAILGRVQSRSHPSAYLLLRVYLALQQWLGKIRQMFQAFQLSLPAPDTVGVSGGVRTPTRMWGGWENEYVAKANAPPHMASSLPPPDTWLCFYPHFSLILLTLDAEPLLRIRNHTLSIYVLAQYPVCSKQSTTKFKNTCLR